MWKSFENFGLQTSEKVSWEKKKKKHEQNIRSTVHRTGDLKTFTTMSYCRTYSWVGDSSFDILVCNTKENSVSKHYRKSNSLRRQLITFAIKWPRLIRIHCLTSQRDAFFESWVYFAIICSVIAMLQFAYFTETVIGLYRYICAQYFNQNFIPPAWVRRSVASVCLSHSKRKRAWAINTRSINIKLGTTHNTP